MEELGLVVHGNVETHSEGIVVEQVPNQPQTAGSGQPQSEDKAITTHAQAAENQSQEAMSAGQTCPANDCEAADGTLNDGAEGWHDHSIETEADDANQDDLAEELQGLDSNTEEEEPEPNQVTAPEDLEAIPSALIPTTGPSQEKAPDLDEPPPKNGGEAGQIPAAGEQPQGSNPFMVFVEPFIVDSFHSKHQTGFVTVHDQELYENMPIRSKRFESFTTSGFYRRFGKLPDARDVRETIDLLEAEALYNSPEKTLYVRHAQANGVVYVDLGRSDFKQVRISKKGWRIIHASKSPVKFIRPLRIRPMPHPENGGSLKQLEGYLNITDPQEFALISGWLVGAMRPDGPYPILVLMGEQGSGKSSFCRCIVDLVGPNYPELTSPPRSEHDLMISADKTNVLCFDNLSSIHPWLADALCRLATGGGFATRTLRTDDHETIFEGRKPIIINGISRLIERHDLADRAIVIVVAPISKAKRRLESNIKEGWKKDKPKILGAIFTAVAAGLRNQASVELQELPRMADFAQWVAAAASDGALPFDPEFFLKAYSDNRMAIVDDALEVDSVGQAVTRLLYKEGDWSGTPTKLLGALNQIAPDSIQKQREWPKQPNVLSGRLRRVATFLREKNIEVEFSKSGARNITLTHSVAAVHDELGQKMAQISEMLPIHKQPTEAPQMTIEGDTLSADVIEMEVAA